ncbi:MAG TPA: homoserine O-succinyltransferase [Xanthobacteraceae bacterium]|nr:homoserine O-succinyltransferase [Xanthobacteraceae bacterium]
MSQSPPFAADHPHHLDLAIINNMRDAAKGATERQYLRLLAAASDGFVVRITFYSLTDTASHHEQATGDIQYRSIATLWEQHLDAVIVTGTEPKAADLKKEPYWSSLTHTVDWCHDNVSSVIFSCLAAHAAVLHRDGIKRQPLPQKCFGIFPCGLVTWHPLLAGMALPLLVQHSRWNALAPAQLQSAGYSVLTASTAAGADIFVKNDKCLSLFFQGHPEYAQDTLMREYRRDVARYLKNESNRYPALPEGCIGDSDAAALLAFRDRALAEPHLVGSLPLPSAPAHQFHSHARRLYRNWLTTLAALKARRLRSKAQHNRNNFTPHRVARRVDGARSRRSI